MSELVEYEPTVSESKDAWLHRTINKSRRTLLLMFKPMELVQRGHTVTIPCKPEEALALFRDLDDHFHSWTGERLNDFIRHGKDKAPTK